MIQRTISLLSVVAIVVGIIAAGVGCAGKAALLPPEDPEELIPEGSNLIVHIDWARIINDADFRSSYEESAGGSDLPSTAEDALDWVEAETKFVLEEFSQAWLFADTSRMEGIAEGIDVGSMEGIAEGIDVGSMEGGNLYLGILAEGAFDKSEFIAAIAGQVQKELTPREYKGYQVYEAEGMAVAFLKEDLLVFGPTAAVEDVIKVAEGEKKRASGPFYDLYASLGAVMLKGAGVVPAEAMQDLISELSQEQIPFEVAGLADLNSAGLALDKSGDTLSLQLVLSFDNADSAGQVSTTLQQLIGMAGMMPSGAGGFAAALAQELLKKVEISVQGNRVNITFEITLTEIEDTIQSVQSAAGGP